MNKKAASLIEIIIGMLILTVIVLGIAATTSLMGGAQSSSGAGNLEMQATNYARQVLENLKNLVSTNATTNQFLIGSAGGTTYNDATSPNYCPLPAGNFKNVYNGTRTYTVWDIDQDADGVIDYKRVTANVTWNG